MQDGSGNTTQLYISQNEITLEQAPTRDFSLARKKEVYEGFVYAQVNSLIFG